MYHVTVDKFGTRIVDAKTPGAAFRKVIKQLIKANLIKRQPPTEYDGGWKGVSIQYVP